MVLEAKKEEKNPLDGKEQARKYAHSLNVRFVILSNGNLHYFWDLEIGNPEVITEFPTQESFSHKHKFKPNNAKLYEEAVNEDYIVSSQKPELLNDPNWSNPAEKNRVGGQTSSPYIYALTKLKLFKLYSILLNRETNVFFLNGNRNRKNIAFCRCYKAFFKNWKMQKEFYF